MRFALRSVRGRSLSSKVAAPPSRMHEMRQLANKLIGEEQWQSAIGPLEALRVTTTPQGGEWRRATTELAFCMQAQNRPDDAAKLYETALGETAEPWAGAAVALLNYAELRAQQERYDEAEGLATRAIAAFKEGDPVDVAAMGAATANLGTYVGMQGRYAEAADKYGEAVKMLNKSLGADSEFAISAAASYVRALRAAKKEEEATQFLATCSVAVVQAVAESKRAEENPEEVDEKVHGMMDELFERLTDKKSFDPPGFVREAMGNDEDSKEFMKSWNDLGLPTDPKMMEAIIEGVEKDFENGTPENGKERRILQMKL